MQRSTLVRAASLVTLAVMAAAATSAWVPESPPPARPPAVRLATLPTPGTTSSHPSLQQATSEGTVEGARAFSQAFADVAEAVIPAVVQIQAEQVLSNAHGMGGRYEDLFEQLPEGHPTPDFPAVAGGSGVLVSADGLILTNNHVISGAERITVTLWDKRRFEATVVGADPTTDLALILIDQGGLPAAPIGDSDRLRVGEWVLAIGNPGFRDANTLDFTVTSGIVSAKGRPLDVIQSDLYSSGNPAARYAIEDFIQTDAAINPGNSGGPLIDLDGTVVGINTAIASVTGANEGYGFAVPINVAKRVMEDLLQYGRVRRPLLGISIQNVAPEDAQVYGLPRIAGVLVEDFADDSPAERAGMRRHDVIVAIDGVPVERLGQFQRLVAQHAPGQRVTVEAIRFGERRRFQVQLTEADLGRSRVVRTSARRAPDRGLGIEVVDISASLARERQFDRAGGAVISDVIPGSPAARRGVQRGVMILEINRTAVASAHEAKRILEAMESGAVVSLLLELPGGETTIRNIRNP